MRRVSKPASVEAVTALGLSILAVALAIIGVYNPWNSLRFPVERGQVGWLAAAAFCLLPIALGVTAALLGGHSVRSLERSHGKIIGDGPAFFSLMIGLFAVTIGICTTFASIVWPMVV